MFCPLPVPFLASSNLWSTLYLYEINLFYFVFLLVFLCLISFNVSTSPSMFPEMAGFPAFYGILSLNTTRGQRSRHILSCKSLYLKDFSLLSISTSTAHLHSSDSIDNWTPQREECSSGTWGLSPTEQLERYLLLTPGKPTCCSPTAASVAQAKGSHLTSLFFSKAGPCRLLDRRKYLLSSFPWSPMT
jgi:hypothetical protein